MLHDICAQSFGSGFGLFDLCDSLGGFGMLHSG